MPVKNTKVWNWETKEEIKLLLDKLNLSHTNGLAREKLGTCVGEDCSVTLWKLGSEGHTQGQC